ncbi:MAG: amidase [Deltaproteobacteria bacterium]|nr:MAG: amidase [Deltaproteobacteria bacterium]
MEPLADLDAIAQSELVRRGELKPVELVDAAVARVEALNARLNAVIAPLFGKARARALASDPRGGGAFVGVPILLQDLGAQTAGDPHHAGVKVLREIGWVENDDSLVVQKLARAGFALLGKTNTSELGLLPATEPEAYGATHNPWDLRRSAGGSAGGSAAAVAAGLVPVAHGIDRCGSIRIAASSCGLVGLKPSRGRVSVDAGVVERWSGFWVEHVISRSVRDSAAVLDALCGALTGDRHTLPAPARPFLAELDAEPERLRVGLMSEGPRDTPVHPECAAAANHAARLLAGCGHHVEDSYPDALDDPESMGPFATVIMAAVLRDVGVWGERIGRRLTQSDVEPLTWAVCELARKSSISRYLAAVEFLNGHGRRLGAWWDTGGFDLLVCPTSGEPPPPLGKFGPEPGNPFAGFVRAATISAFASPWNLTGQPAISLPLYWSRDGLPIGVQLVAAFGREDRLLSVAAQLERAQPWRDRRPPVYAGSS